MQGASWCSTRIYGSIIRLAAAATGNGVISRWRSGTSRSRRTIGGVRHTHNITHARTRTQTYHMRAKESFQVPFRLKMDTSVIKGIKFRLVVR